jgi:hypothetical protein
VSNQDLNKAVLDLALSSRLVFSDRQNGTADEEVECEDLSRQTSLICPDLNLPFALFDSISIQNYFLLNN